MLKNKLLEGSFGHISYCFWPYSSSIYSKNFGSRLRSSPFHANCNLNAVSVQCMQIAIRALRVCGGAACCVVRGAEDDVLSLPTCTSFFLLESRVGKKEFC